MSAIAIPTPTVDALLDRDGLYTDVGELRVACTLDGLSEHMTAIFIDDFEESRNAEWAAESAAEIAAENAWLVHAENAGWEETEAERAYDAARGVYW